MYFGRYLSWISLISISKYEILFVSKYELTVMSNSDDEFMTKIDRWVTLFWPCNFGAVKYYW